MVSVKIALKVKIQNKTPMEYCLNVKWLQWQLYNAQQDSIDQLMGNAQLVVYLKLLYKTMLEVKEHVNLPYAHKHNTLCKMEFVEIVFKDKSLSQLME